MKLVVGLGNPGAALSAHAAQPRVHGGRRAGRTLARRRRRQAARCRAAARAAFAADARRCFAKPQTFMNASGEAVAQLAPRSTAWTRPTSWPCTTTSICRSAACGSAAAAGPAGTRRRVDDRGARRKGFARLRIGIGRPPGGVRAGGIRAGAVHPGRARRRATRRSIAPPTAVESWLSSTGSSRHEHAQSARDAAAS